jgi:hypothetical protein
MSSTAHPYHPYDPLNSKSAGLAAGKNPDRDPLTPATADTLTNGSLETPGRATPALPPTRVAPSGSETFPMPTAKPTPGVGEYKPAFTQHDNGVPVCGGENND